MSTIADGMIHFIADRRGTFPESTADAMTLQAISHYRILEKLGAGGMGEVYLAEDVQLGRRVALKLLPGEFTHSEDRLRRFVQEAKAASALNHPNIITIHEIGQEDTIHFIATEFIEGETLRQRLLRARIPVGEALEIAVQVVSALSAAHQVPIVHRDIKPENIMIRPDGYVKLLDFGLAKLLEVHDLGSMTQAPTVHLNTEPGTFMGTVRYMSPEQVRGLAVDTQSDIFSFGVVLYEMISGRAPFEGSTTADTLVSILQSSPPLVSLPPGVPLELNQVLNKCLEKGPGRRYQSAQQLLSDLKNLTGGRSQEYLFAKPSLSIAVLPFVNMSADPENEYFCDGLAEELLNALAKIDELRVAARTSAFSFKGKEVDIREIGQRLNVGTVLEGSVRTAGGRLRITAQLVNVADGYHLWSERYDRRMEGVFEIQDEITSAIVEALKLKLLGEEKQVLLKRYTDSTEAYEYYLKGLYHYNKYTQQGLKKAIEFFERAIEADPNYALAYAVLANTYGTLVFFGNLAPAGIMPKITSMAEKALELDGDLAEAHLLMANYMFHVEFDFEEAGKEYRKAIELNPSSAEARLFYAHYLQKYEKRFEQAIAQGKRGLELDPLSLTTTMVYGILFVSANQHDRALEQSDRLLKLEANFYGGHWLRAAVYTRQARHEEAIAECEKAISLGSSSQVSALLAYSYGKAGNRTGALEIIEELKELRNQGYALAYQIAMGYASLDKDEALAWLEKAYDERNMALTGLDVESPFDELRSAPRFKDLRHRIGFKS